MKFKKERTRQKILTPCGDRRYSSSQHQREGGLSCSAWWAERLEAAWSSGVFFPPINKPPKNKQFHPTEKEMGRWDKREGQTGVRKEWYLWQRPLREKLEEMRAEDEGVFMKGAPDLLSPSCWPADVVWILGQDFIFWSAWYLMNCTVDTVTISESHYCINDTIVWRGAQDLRHIIFEMPSRKNERRCLEFSWQKHSVVQKSDESDRTWANLIHCHLDISLQRGGECGRGCPYCTFSTGVMKVRAAAALPTSQITLNTSGDRGKTPGSDGRCALPVCLLRLAAYQVIPGDTVFIISH